jgi:LysM repeat protein
MRLSFAVALLVIGAVGITIAPRPVIADATHYTVQAGDYLVLIGQKFGVPWQSIAEANDISAPYVIFPGQSLAIPSPPECQRSDSKGTQYTVKVGDDLVLIGTKFGVPWQQIAEGNCIKAPYLIFPGQSLMIPLRQQCADGDVPGTQYTVKAGDYLVLIGQRFGVPWQEIAEANCIASPYIIYPGQMLIVPQEQDEDQD